MKLRLNVFRNGIYPSEGKVILFQRENSLKEFRSLVETEFPSYTCYQLFTEKGGEITDANQFFHDDIIVFTSVSDKEMFEPLFAPNRNKSAITDASSEDADNYFTLSVKWLSDQTQNLEKMTFHLDKSKATVRDLKKKVPKQIRNYDPTPFQTDEFLVVYKGVELLDDCNLYQMYTEHRSERQKRKEVNNSEFTVFIIKKPFVIRVMTPAGRKIVLTMEYNDAPDITVRQLKQMIYEQEKSLPCNRMKLYFENELLKNDSTLDDCGLLGNVDRTLQLKYTVFN
jgi:hypothetical protein